MCIGQPMRVVEMDDTHAWCEVDGQRERLDMALVGTQPVGTWVLAFLGGARQVLGDEEAAQACAGRKALAAVLAGSQNVDSFFSDLVDREPQLPAHLRPAETPPTR